MPISDTPIEGIVETILYVDDLSRSIAFYRDVLQFVPIAGDAVRFKAFQVGSRQVLILFLRGGTLQPVVLPGGTIPPHDGSGRQHIALAVSAEDLDAWEARLGEHGIAVEGRTAWNRGGRSIYSLPDWWSSRVVLFEHQAADGSCQSLRATGERRAGQADPGAEMLVDALQS